MKNPRLVRELKQELVRSYEKYVRAVAKAAHVSRETAREGLHRATCRLLSRLTHSSRQNPILAWKPFIIRAAINELRDAFAERKDLTLFCEFGTDEQENLPWIMDPRPVPAQQAEKHELAGMAWNALRGLSRHERGVIARRCNGQSFAEVAAALDIKSSTARGFWTTGIVKLRIRFRTAA